MWRARSGLLALALWPRRCRCEEDAGHGGEQAALWRRGWQADWDGRAPVEKMKAVGRIRHSDSLYMYIINCLLYYIF